MSRGGDMCLGGSVARLLVVGIAVACLSCAGHASAPYGERFVPAELEGAALGMTVTQLRAARPGTLLDGAQVWERLEDGSAEYLMADGGLGRVAAAAFCDCTVRGIALSFDVPFSDSIGQRARADSIARRWSSLPGLRLSRRLEGRFGAGPAEATLFEYDEAVLILIVGNPARRTSSTMRILRAFVLDTAMSLRGRVPE